MGRGREASSNFHCKAHTHTHNSNNNKQTNTETRGWALQLNAKPLWINTHTRMRAQRMNNTQGSQEGAFRLQERGIVTACPSVRLCV